MTLEADDSGMRSPAKLLTMVGMVALAAGVVAQPVSAASKTIYVNPKQGSDRAAGTKRKPLKSLDAAWTRAKSGTTIRIAAGKVRVGATYYEKKDRIRIVGAGMTKTSVPPLNIYGVEDFTLQATSVAGDVHCEACDGFTMDKVRVLGAARCRRA